ncbi:MAG: YjgP/YjgQ family permease [Halobacteriovoraceae bacterium]|jgi:lipopolysaccharide export system permease protein|nr:YjgP/YjgQ family permease [Halobacteriovoraceae bacterium]
MYILKRLIIREWYRFFFSGIVILFLLVAIANLISGFLRDNVTGSEVILNFLLESPKYINQILPVACLVASLFCINKLKNRNELTAIFAAGYSRKKFLLNIVQASLFIAAFQFILSAYIKPYAKGKRGTLIDNYESKFRNLKSKGLKASTIGSGKIWYKSASYYFSFSTFDKFNNILNDITLFRFDQNYLLKSKIIGEKLVFKEGKSWTLHNGVTYDFLNNKDFPVVSKKDLYELTLNEVPEDFRQIQADITTLNFFSLWTYIRTLNQAGINTNEYLVILLDQISSSLICIIFSLIAAIAIFNPNRRNSSFGKNIVFVFVFTILYWLIYSWFTELGRTSKLNPYLACFSVPVLFTGYLAYYLNKNKQIT